MLPFLAGLSAEVVAADIDLMPLENMQRHIPLAPTVQIRDISKNALSELPTESFDLIIALDVLEHVKDLSGTVKVLLRLLAGGGQLVISGPTENILYRFGRKIAGAEYSGDYHERSIAEIRQELADKVVLRHIATLYWPVPLFEIFAASA